MLQPNNMSSTPDPSTAYTPPQNGSQYSHFTVPTDLPIPDSIPQYPGPATPIVIDFGSYRVRAGYASPDVLEEAADDSVAAPHLNFKPLVGKLRGAKKGQRTKYAGNDFTYNLYTKLHMKSSHTGEVITNQGITEDLLDYLFEGLGLSEDTNFLDSIQENQMTPYASGVPNPVVLTETICNPTSTRALVSELLFEYYNMPSVMYGVDATFSLYKHLYDVNHQKNQNHSSLVSENLPSHALLIRSGFHSTHVIPIIDSQIDSNNIKRLPLGGFHTTDYTSKLLHNKYPHLKQYNSILNAEKIKETHMYIPRNYWEQLNQLAHDEPFYWKNTHIVQLPFIPQKKAEEKTQQEIEEQEERKRKRHEKLERLARERQEEKLRLEEEALTNYRKMQGMKDTDPQTYSLWMTQYGFQTEADIEKGIKDILGKRERREKRREEREKRKQKLAQQAQVEKPKSEMEILKENNPKEWLKRMKAQRDELKKLIERKKVETGKASGSRGRRAASKKRLRAITTTLDTSEKEVNFGRSDADWEVYREIGSSTQTALENHEAHLEQIQDDIDDMELALFDKILSQEKKMHYMKQYNFLAAASSRRANPSSTRNLHEAEFYQYHLTVERMRVPEIMFQPQPLLGMKNCGLMEMIDICLRTYEPQVVQQIVRNVHISGGNTKFEGMRDRIQDELTRMLPVGTEINVTREETNEDAWRGAAYAALDTDYLAQNSVTKQEYEECGAEYLKEHAFSNRLWK